MTRDTQYRVKIDDWNEKGENGRGALRSSYGNDYQRCNNQLHDFLRDIDGKIKEYNKKHPNKVTPEIVHSILYGEPLTRDDEGKDFVEFVKDVLQKRLTANKIKGKGCNKGYCKTACGTLCRT